MRTITLLSLLILINCSCFGQFFEGIIVYKSQFISSSPKYLHRVDTSTFFIKGNMIRLPSIFMLDTAYSLLRDGKSYFVSPNNHSISEDISYDPDRQFFDEIKALRQSSKKEEIKGFPYKKYRGINNSDGMEDIYDLLITDSIMPQIDFSYLIHKDIGIALKLIFSTEMLTLIMDVVKIEQIALDDSIFKLPDYPIKQVDMSKVAKAYIKEQKK